MTLRKWVESATKVLASWGGAGSIADEFWKHRSEHEERKAKVDALLDATETEWRPDASPAALLRADFGVVPFHGRKAELEDLEAWATTDGPKVAVRLYTAPGGFGKTRLLQEHARRWNQSAWGRAGFLREGQVLELGAELLFDGEEKPLLVVLDYAESRGAEIEAVVKTARADGSSRLRTRIVLLARSEGDWWAALRKVKDGVADFFQGPFVEGPLALAPLTDSAFYSPGRSAPHPPGPLLLAAEEKGGSEGSAVLAARRESFDLAARAFAERLGKAVSAGVPPLDGEDFERVLLIHAAALAAVEQETVPSGGLLDWLLLREERGLDRVRAACGLGAEYGRAMRHGAVLLTLAQGAGSTEEVVEILRRVPSLADQPRARLDQIAEALHVLYRGRRWCDGVEPDLVGEHLVRKELDETPELIAAAFGEGVPEERLEGGLTVLNRLAQRDEARGRELLRRVLDAGLDRLGLAAVRVAVAGGDPIGQVLAEALEARGSIELVRQIQPHLPYPTTALRETGAIVYGMLRHNLLARGVVNLDQEAREALAWWSTDLSSHLADLGRREESLEIIQEALDLYRDLAQNHPDTYQPSLAICWHNLSNRLASVDRREEALEAIEQAVAIRRFFAERQPDTDQSSLALSLNNQSNRLADLGRREEALEAIRRAVDLYRELVQKRPDAFRGMLATSLTNLARHLAVLAHYEKSFEANQEAVCIFRDLAQERPDTFRLDLAKSLENLSLRLGALGHHAKALTTIQEAIDSYKFFSRRRPDAFASDLASGLRTLSLCLANLGRREEALETSREAVDLYRDLARQRPDAFRPDLARSFKLLHDRLSEANRTEEALRAAVEAIDTLEPHFRRYPAAHAGLMSVMLQDYEATAQATDTPIDEPRLQELRQILATVQPPA